MIVLLIIGGVIISKDDPSFKRLGTILFLFIVVLLISACQAVLLNDSEAYDTLTGEETQTLDVTGTVMDIIGFFFGGFLLKVWALPFYMTLIIIPIYLILIVVFWYLVLDFIKDIEILGSSI